MQFDCKVRDTKYRVVLTFLVVTSCQSVLDILDQYLYHSEPEHLHFSTLQKLFLFFISFLTMGFFDQVITAI